LSELKNNIRKLIRHKEASTVIETFYGQYANAQQRKALLAEFYGPEFTLFANSTKDAEINTIDELLEKHPEKKDAVMRYMSETLGGCTDKGTVGNSIIHKALFEYFSRADEKGIQVNYLLIFHRNEDGYATNWAVSSSWENN
jgi:pumilio family protein 6